VEVEQEEMEGVYKGLMALIPYLALLLQLAEVEVVEATPALLMVVQVGQEVEEEQQSPPPLLVALELQTKVLLVAMETVSSLPYGGGGGGSGNGPPRPAGGSGIGGVGSDAGTTSLVGENASPANRGSGGGGAYQNAQGGNGSSGVVILKYPDAYTISNPGGGLTLSTAGPSGGFKVTSVTAGTGNVSFA
jgi:hypothetical protein